MHHQGTRDRTAARNSRTDTCTCRRQRRARQVRVRAEGRHRPRALMSATLPSRWCNCRVRCSRCLPPSAAQPIRRRCRQQRVNPKPAPLEGACAERLERAEISGLSARVEVQRVGVRGEGAAACGHEHCTAAAACRAGRGRQRASPGSHRPSHHSRQHATAHFRLTPGQATWHCSPR